MSAGEQAGTSVAPPSHAHDTEASVASPDHAQTSASGGHGVTFQGSGAKPPVNTEFKTNAAPSASDRAFGHVATPAAHGPATAPSNGEGSERLRRLIATYGSSPDQLAAGIVATHATRDQKLWTALRQTLGNTVTVEVHKQVTAKTHVPTCAEIMASELEIDGAAIEAASAQYGVPATEIRAIITQESRGNADANAGAAQPDQGIHAASGLMQVTEVSWKQAQHAHAELASYDFATYRYDRRVNILVGTAVLASKRRALENMGIDPKGPQIAALTSMAYNAGEGLVQDAYHRARKAGSKQPDVDCLLAEYLKPAIRDYPSVYAYYLTGGGKSRNPTLSVDSAVDLKFEEISRYPAQIDVLVRSAPTS
jgi:soluble lytic murein transglycosylase-like protein